MVAADSRQAPWNKALPGNLSRDCTEGEHAFQVVGVDYAGLLTYCTKKRKEAKAYSAVA